MQRISQMKLAAPRAHSPRPWRRNSLNPACAVVDSTCASRARILVVSGASACLAFVRHLTEETRCDRNVFYFNSTAKHGFRDQWAFGGDTCQVEEWHCF